MTVQNRFYISANFINRSAVIPRVVTATVLRVPQRSQNIEQLNQTRKYVLKYALPIEILRF